MLPLEVQSLKDPVLLMAKFNWSVANALSIMCGIIGVEDGVVVVFDQVRVGVD